MAKTLVLQIYAVIFYDCQEIDFLEKDQVWQKSQKKERNKLFSLSKAKEKTTYGWQLHIIIWHPTPKQENKGVYHIEYVNREGLGFWLVNSFKA